MQGMAQLPTPEPMGRAARRRVRGKGRGDHASVFGIFKRERRRSYKTMNAAEEMDRPTMTSYGGSTTPVVHE